MITSHSEARQTLRNTVAYIGNTGRRAFDAIVYELATAEGQVVRTITLKTSGTLHRDADKARAQRTARRLRALGFRLNWSAMCHPQDGIGGTVRIFRA